MQSLLNLHDGSRLQHAVALLAASVFCRQSVASDHGAEADLPSRS